MHISLSRMVGMPVVLEDQQVGYVERAVMDARCRMLDGMVVRRGIGAAKWVSCGEIALLGRDCVVLKSRPVRLTVRDQPSPCRVFLSAGAYAGEVTDAFVSSRGLRISALEVCQGPLYRLVGQRSYAPHFCVQEDGGVVAQTLLSWAQLVKQLGEEDDG